MQSAKFLSQESMVNTPEVKNRVGVERTQAIILSTSDNDKKLALSGASVKKKGVNPSAQRTSQKLGNSGPRLSSIKKSSERSKSQGRSSSK